MKNKTTLKEGIAPQPAVTYDEFKEAFYDEVFGEGLLNDNWRDVIRSLTEKAGLSSRWGAYSDRDENLFALNVKYKGQGDWDKFNKDGRAEKHDIGQETYWDILQTNIKVFYDDWNARFKKELGYELYVAGRSGGYWGVKADFLDHEDEDFLVIDDAALKGLYDKLLPTVDFSDVDSDHVYDMVDAAMGEVAGKHGWTDSTKVAQYFKFSDKFINLCNEFEQSVEAQSANYETQEFNDGEFDNLEVVDDEEVSEGGSYESAVVRETRKVEIGRPRAFTSALIEDAEQGLLSWESIARAALGYMSENEVQDMAESDFEYEADDGSDDEDDESDDEVMETRGLVAQSGD